jgi:uncharacterized protein YrrD
MSVLMRTSEVAKRPVVTLAGEDVAQVKDVIYAGGGEIAGFTLNGRGRFSGPLKSALAWSAIEALGPDAIMITDDKALIPRESFLSETGASAAPHGGDVLGSRVLTTDGTDLGKVIDVIIEIADGTRRKADVVGYEIEPSEAFGSDAKNLLIPLPDTVAASAENLIVPSSTREFVSHDLAGFGASFASFRKQLKVEA